MLTDQQVDELENVIFSSSIDDLPMVLGKALPLLFAELRIVRATLDSKVSTFLEGKSVSVPEATSRGSSSPVHRETPEPEAGDRGIEGEDGAEGSDGSDQALRRRTNGVTGNTGGSSGGEGEDQAGVATGSSTEKVDRKEKPKPARRRRSRSKQVDAVLDEDVPDLT